MNIQSVRGGKVHRNQTWDDELVFPTCRTGGQNTNGTYYVETDAPVDCKACGPERRTETQI